MTVLRRSAASRQILALAQRLAEDYESIPLPEVSRIVQDATTAAVASAGPLAKRPAGMATLLADVEQLARRELDWVCADRARRPGIRRERVAPARAAAAPSRRRQGAA
jgi:hypothetical protein